MVVVRIEFRMRCQHHFRALMLQQPGQIGHQIVPVRLAVGITRQAQAVMPTHRTDIGFSRLTRTESLLRAAGHLAQPQAKIPQLETVLLRHSAPQRHGEAVPTAQAAFEPRGLGSVQAHIAVIVGFDFTLSEGHDRDFGRTAVKTEGRQFSVVGMRRDDQQALRGEIGIIQCVHSGLRSETAKAPAQRQASVHQRRTLPGEVEKTFAIDTTFHVLTVVANPHLRIEKTPQPVAFDVHLEHQRLGRDDVTRKGQPAVLQSDRTVSRALGKVITVIVGRRIKQVIGEPRLVGEPAEQQEHRQRPPGNPYPEQHGRQRRADQYHPLALAVTFKQLLLASTHDGVISLKSGRPGPGGTSDPCIPGRRGRTSSAAVCLRHAPAPRPSGY
ncbi:hypothetical protein ALQ52_04428 [Pseudomonas cannabina pv. alisalensis]|nr:hypothetical protein ALQ52_04428 [Pseudomonas cannabina pv. alisalensis]